MAEENDKMEKVVPRKVKGTMTFLTEDDIEFRAQRSTGTSTQSVVKSDGKSKLYRTVGDKKKSMIAHLVVDEDDSDPAASMFSQLEKLTKDMQPKKLPQQRGKILLDDKEVRIALSKSSKQIDIRLAIDLTEHPNYDQCLMSLMYKINQCFAINQTLLRSVRK